MRAFLHRLSIALSILSCSFAYSQSVGIGDEKFTPHPSALLELKSGAKGLLIPRVTESDRQAIDNPAEGLLIYQTDGSAGFYLYSASRWSLLITESNLPVDDNQQLSFNLTNYRLTLENGGEVDLSILRNGRSLIETIDNGDGTFTFKYNDGTSFTTRNLQGPQGLKGDKGTDGTNGVDGADGQDGNTILNGNIDPNNTQGTDGDIYINTATNTYFGPKTAGVWGAGTSLIGPAGADGADGTNGIDGTNGVDGQDGNTILSGNTDPMNTQGKDGDIYINTATNTYFGPKTTGVWGAGTSLIGPAGADGTDGTNGINGTNGVDGQDGNTILSGNTDPNNTQGTDGDIYINTATNTYFGPKTAGVWGAGTSLIGPAGADGADGTNGIDGTNGTDGQDGNTILSGNTDPNNTQGKDGDIYINTATNTYFGPKTAGVWGAGTSLVGPAGADGADGADGINGIDGTNGTDGQDGNTILSGNTDPINAQGKDGDIYINTATNTYFGPKTAGAWGAGTSLIGPAGADGADGTNGIDGTNGVDGQDGNTILSGNTDPNNTQGKDGDIYINTATNTYFGPKTTGVWSAGTSLIGPAGADGADGTNGIDGTNGTDGQDGNTILSGNTDPNNTQGKDGDIYINTATNTYFGPKTAGVWGAGTSLVGPAGADGADGADGINGIDGTNGTDGQDGNTILSGNTDPINAQGKDGDIYINTATNTYFGPKTAGAWGAGTSLIGPAGADGADGTNGIDGTNGVDGQDGNTILSGNTDPNNTQGKDGDIYINTATNTYFGPKTTGVWSAGTSLIGPAGADGADGTDGTNGIDGTNGADGQDGNTVLSGSSNPTNATGNTGDFYYNFNTFTFFGPKTGTGWPAGVVLKGTGISSTLDNPDGSLTFNFTDGTSFTSQPDGDFSDTNELITSLSLSGSSLQIREGGINRSVDLSSIGTSSEITDTDNNTLITVDNSGANDDIIRFSIQGNETMRLRNRTLELLANSGSTFIGESAGISSSGAGNVGLGSETMLNNSSGRFNVAVGYRALRQNATGQGNVAIGYNAGFNETGSNKLYIANSNTNTPLIWGDFQAGVANINGKLGVGVANPAAMTNELEVNGHATVITLTETSDQRFKKNILPLENSLSKLLSLRGVSYQWRIDDFPNRRFKEGSNIGLIAQEVQQLFPELVSTNSEGFLSVSYSGLSPIIIEAMKEQQKLIEDLQSELKEADNRYKALLERISSIEQALKNKIDKMRFALLYGLLIWLPQNLAAQGQLAISEGTFFQSFDNVSLNIDDTELLTDGELIGTNSNIFISSNFAQTNLGGEGNNHFGRLYLYSPNGEFLLVNSIEINDLLELNKSSLNLGSADLIFPSEGGYLEGETNEFRVYSKNGGKIIKTTTLNKPQNVSPGNLGFIISSNENLGLTEIYRTHSSTTLPSGEGISKTFELYTDINPSSPLNISISYFDTEAKNMDYEPQIWMLENTGEWTHVRTSSERNSDTQSNRVSANISEPTLTYTVGPEKVYPVDISSIPTAFTPNGDGTNDTFLIPFIDEDFNGRVTIISRWGDVIYSSDNYYYAPWDGHYKGKLMPTATYYYVVSFGSDQRNEIKGNISIVR